jgi:hypothetical protein
MPLAVALCVPKGRTRIARRFNAGLRSVRHQSQRDGCRIGFNRPFGTPFVFCAGFPALKRRAILKHPFGITRPKS